MNDTVKMFLISLIVAVLVQILMGPQIMKMNGLVPANQVAPTPQPVVIQQPAAPTEPAAQAPQPIPAPDYRGITAKKARSLASAQGIVIIEDEQREAEDKRPGEIIEQLPPPGTMLVNREIRVVTAKGKDDVRIPSVVGKSLEEATKELEALGFEVPAPIPQDSNKTPGTVLDQDPKPNSRMATGSDVKLTIASLPMLEVPKLTGKYLRTAKSTLQEAGLELGQVRRVEHAEHGEGYVLRQEPAAGDKVPFGTEVSLVVVAPN
ncbi:MAG: PASTA domain-containing protein [Myxococcales bacterium]|nr:PASTA domain-containing protein [Myxococcales bacterium]MCB9704298.1 PASTA domain-containing protein [Myxococcales bacterium]